MGRGVFAPIGGRGGESIFILVEAKKYRYYGPCCSLIFLTTSVFIMDKKVFYQKILTRLFSIHGKMKLLNIFNNSIIHDFKDGVITIGVPLLMSRQYLQERYHRKILELAQELEPSVRDIQYEVMPSLVDQPHPDKVDLDHMNPGETPTVRKVPNKQEVIIDGKMRSNIMKHTLDNYITGAENRLVHAACMAVAAKPGDIYNPLYIYGGVGLGKTHLLQATGNHIIKQHPNKRVVYMTAEKFINEIIDAIGKRHTKPFKDTYRNVDCLIVDDIQFFANKATSEQEFFHTFNELYDAGKQIIMSADRPPRDLNGLDDRLLSRFAMGMVIEVCVPGFETRVAILQQKCVEHGELIDREILEFIAYNVTSSVREMIGILITVIAQSKLENAAPNLRSVAELIRKLGKSQELVGFQDSTQKPVVRSFDDVIELVASYYKLTRSELVGEERRKEVMVPRQICMYLIRQILDQSYETIGENFGGRNHTTVLHSCNKIDERLKVDQRLMRDFNTLKKEMGM